MENINPNISDIRHLNGKIFEYIFFYLNFPVKEEKERLNFNLAGAQKSDWLLVELMAS